MADMTRATRRDLVSLIHDLRESEPPVELALEPDGDRLRWALHLPDSAPELLRQRLTEHREAVTAHMAAVLTERLSDTAALPFWERMTHRAMLDRDTAENPVLMFGRTFLHRSHGPATADQMFAEVLLALACASDHLDGTARD